MEYLITEEDDYCWTAPKWAKPGDIVFFMHSKSSLQTIRRLKKELKCNKDILSKSDYVLLSDTLERGEELYNRYGGKIFLIAQIDGKTFEEEPLEYDDNPQWKSRIYTYLTGYKLLEDPVGLDEFNNFIKLSCGGTITPVFGKEFERLKEIVQSKNEVPDYLIKSRSMPIPLSRIDNNNWFEVASKYRFSFLYESQFRTYYVDYFLKLLGDRKTFYRECDCIKYGQHKSWVDNVILLKGKYLPVEVKLSVKAEDDIKKQVRKYCRLDELILNRKNDLSAPIEKVYRDNVLIIDTFGLYVFDYDADSIIEICLLEEIKGINDIRELRNKVIV